MQVREALESLHKLDAAASVGDLLAVAGDYVAEALDKQQGGEVRPDAP